PPVRCRPGAPLRAVDGSEIAVFVGPLVPDGDAILLEIGDIGVTPQEPQQFMDDRPQMQLFRRQDRKAGCEVKAHLVAENGARTGAGAVAAVAAMVHHMGEEIEILLHAGRRFWKCPDFNGSGPRHQWRISSAHNYIPRYPAGTPFQAALDRLYLSCR